MRICFQYVGVSNHMIIIIIKRLVLANHLFKYTAMISFRIFSHNLRNQGYLAIDLGIFFTQIIDHWHGVCDVLGYLGRVKVCVILSKFTAKYRIAQLVNTFQCFPNMHFTCKLF